MTPVQAAAIAKRAHAGQKYGNSPYMRHVEDVVERVIEDPQAVTDTVVVAYLHDVVEDTNTSITDLQTKGLTEEQQTALVAITRRPGEDYGKYITERVCRNLIAARVKWHDMASNIEHAPPLETLHRYLKWRTYLSQVLKL